jgi:hypothetical protein
LILGLEETIIIGQDVYESSVSHSCSYGVAFEDNLETGYFYAVETKPSLQVLDSLHVYNVDDVNHKHIPRKLQIAWSDDGLVASLLINNHCHAIFDFDNKAGYCRNGFPEPKSEWTEVKERTLTDDLIDQIFASRK